MLWALGEQSPLAVRGQTMQDVIFAGAAGVQSRNAAEVEVLLDNSDGGLDSGFSEISIVRKLSRDGEGEYRLNGARCRLVDVLEVLSDTGLGKEMHSVVSQGRVESIIHSKPRDRRLLIEEAAGLGKHRKRRRRAQLKLERTQDNLARSLDVEREARSRLRPLKRQAEAAELHQRLERQSLEAGRELAADDLRAARADLADAERAAAAAGGARDEAERLLAEVAKRREAAEEAFAEHSRARERLSSSLFAARAATDGIALRAERAHEAAQAAADDAARDERDAAELEAGAVAEGDTGAQERIAALEAELRTLDSERDSRLEVELAELEQERVEAEGRRDAAAAELERLRAAVLEAERAVEEARTAQRQAERDADAARADAAKAGSELAAVNHFLGSAAAAPDDARTLAAELKVDAGFELAVASALGSRLRAGVVNSLGEGEALLDGLRDGGSAILAAHPARPAAAASPCAGAAADPRSRAPAGGPGARRRAAARRRLARRRPGEPPARLHRGRDHPARALPVRLDRGAAPGARGRGGANPRGARVAGGAHRRVTAGRSRRDRRQRRGRPRPARWLRSGSSGARKRRRRRARRRGRSTRPTSSCAAPRAGSSCAAALPRKVRPPSGAPVSRRTSAPSAGWPSASSTSAPSGSSGWCGCARAPSAAARSRRRRSVPRGALQRAAEAVAAHRDVLAEQLAADEAVGEQTAAELRACAREEVEIQARLKEASDAVTHAEVRAQQARDVEHETMARLAEIATKLELSAEPAEEPLEAERREELAAKVERLARRREQLGPVNPLAEQEYEEAVAHVEELEAQRNDLESALSELESLIKETDRRIREAFEETFEQAARNFEDVVGHLFPGGRGRLRLVRPDGPKPVIGGEEVPEQPDDEEAADEQPDEEEPGVEVEVTPAGKSMKKLSLLSGGEKSLVALAFMFAVFLARPCPFYILDEVEAALDDVNIDRFLQLVHEYSGRAQFIIVTHQKRTMDAADVLYGVSMGGDGISKVVSRKLPTREQPLEAVAGADEAAA